MQATERSPGGPWLGKAVLITGGSTGLGRAIAETFARLGAATVIAARHADALQQTAEDLRRQTGGQVHPIAADVTQQDDVDRLLHDTLHHCGRLDVLVNNAGRSDRGAVLDVTPEQFQALWDLNFLGTVRCTRAAVPHLLRHGGHVVNIASLAAKVAPRYMGAYPASKFPVAAYTQQLRLELQPQGLHVLLVCPGPIARDTPRRYAAAGPSEIPPDAQRPGAGARLRAIDPRRLAQQIERACRRRKAELIVPGRARILFVLQQLSARAGDWLLRRSTR
jgi:NAD(P)-dependent dehydrogenase (short-subunit alcohol dehydrogenase family)